jgi:D-sedoheptulose 7-phosphate isomerase
MIDLKNQIELQLKEHQAVVDRLIEDQQEQIGAMIEVVIAALKQGKRIFFCGNGGSAADAQHLAAEFVVRFRVNRKALAAMALTTDTSILTACGNDFGYEEVFVRQVEAWVKTGDVLIGITTSGNSPNVVKALQSAKQQGAVTVAMTGESLGAISDFADVHLAVPSHITARVQECHIMVGHILCEMIDQINWDLESF